MIKLAVLVILPALLFAIVPLLMGRAAAWLWRKFGGA